MCPCLPTGDAAEEFAVDAGWTTSVAERFADRVIAEAAQHISGLEQTVVGRHILSPAGPTAPIPTRDLASHASGHNALSQAFTQRPIPAHRDGYATVVPDLYLMGAAELARAGCRRLIGSGRWLSLAELTMKPGKQRASKAN